MTPWDDDKSTAADPDNPNADEQLTADEWDNHVTEGHFPADQLNFGTNADGDPIMTDPQTGDTVMQWDRSAGQWVLPAVSTDDLQVANKSYINHITDFSEANGNTASLSSFDSLSSSVPTRQLIVTLLWEDKGTQQDLYLRFNGDGSSTGNYNYVDEAGTESTSENEILLATETNGFGGAVLNLEIGRVFDTVVDIEGTVRFDRATQVAQRGSRAENVDLSSIELVQSSGTDGVLQGRLYERVIA